MSEYGFPHIDRLVVTWVTLITALKDTFDSFHDAWSGVDKWNPPLGVWHFFFLRENGAVPCLVNVMSQSEQI